MPKYKRFSDTSVSEKILDSMFLITIGIGYLFALMNLYYTHQGRDGEPGLSVSDVVIAYYGSHNQTRLGAAINGPMEANLPNSAAKEIILDWINQGATEESFNERVKPIMDENCIACHSAESGMSIPDFTSYANVVQLTKTDTGATIPALVRVSHIHLFGIAFILFFVGRIFLLCEMNVSLKRTYVALPFIFLLLDISSWFITKIIPEFAFVVVAAGGLVGVTFGLQILICLYQMWLYKPKSIPVEM
ncbi:MAG: hypothetical protein COW19_09550 [Zetaproteobacteria bacterium CG12_big_fil_rev_8_21_14_0_65_55_1124]|nr:MAG: hypothetical protein AUJ58_06580 [Zetaproteobacteria bacterium CG1_02_55_237]PIS18940.1 MAG: hypothetical protein COT53_08290 [Zetaproteobacteria bacterium CG08_land_8_20_14_0_20_55_17]PIW42169.1 MAG: hypothetical protein COW19_09550 [Zetaproteobacteria bacterium CG12_big_fil_rev_8_21_14_0_65_55_1124]PIY54349.1 MAG: hypothetical protein COZ01_00695 [Zetaproteobacteria bacterium CG_4_10_14_0_8_um_filter_55_43]PIZ38893.1 MAG: hypothetical protein COY36_04715 [Zetaproteobacteria bacterium 